MHRNQVWVLVALALTLVLSACEGVLYIDLKASGYAVTRYESWAPILLNDVRNPSDRYLSQIVITARCREYPYKNLDQYYESAPFALGPFEILDQVNLRQVRGFPYFTSGGISCTFDAQNRSWPTELEVTITVPK